MKRSERTFKQLEAELTDYLKICQNYVTDLGTLQADNAALLEALELLVYANNKKGTCACGHDGKLTSDLCPIHGVGACKATEALRSA